MSIFYKIENNIIIIYGQTFLLKEEIKAIGGKFNYVTKYWTLPLSDSNLARAAKICGVDLDESEIREEKSRDLNISELIAQVSLAIKKEFSAPVWVIGEVQNVAVKRNGLFLELAEPKDDENSVGAVSVKAVFWNFNIKDKQKKEGFDLEQILCEGMKVRVLCNVDMYKDRGILSLIIIDIDPSFTKGVLALQREKLLRELKKAGLIDKNRELSLTKFPFKVGLITAESSRAKSDFIDQLESYGFPGEVVFYSSQMQGDRTAEDVSRGIKTLSRVECDIIVITRGGGSSMDLRYFDDPKIVYEIVNSSVPIIAAIGHHEDICVSELVAFRREKTPTAAADFILSCFEETKDDINNLAYELEKNFLTFYDRMVSDNRGLMKTVLRFALLNIETQVRKVDTSCARISQLVSEFLLLKKNDLLQLEQKIIAKDPKPWLEQGWTRLYLESSGSMVSSVKQVSVGEILKARLLDGNVKLNVSGITSGLEKEKGE